MKKNLDTKIGCFLTAMLFVLIAVLYTRFPFVGSNESVDTGEISWADAAEKCKARYKTISSSWKIKVPNCRKRTDDEDYFYFYWRRPVSIFVEQPNGKKSSNNGTCQVAKKSGEIVYMTFNKSVIVEKK